MHNPNETPAAGPGTVPAAQYPRFGPPEVLRVVEVPAPAPGPHDLVVEVAAVSVTLNSYLNSCDLLATICSIPAPKDSAVVMMSTAFKGIFVAFPT